MCAVIMWLFPENASKYGLVIQDLFTERKTSFEPDFSDIVALSHGTYKAIKFEKAYANFCYL